LARNNGVTANVSLRTVAVAFIAGALSADQKRVLTNAIETYMDNLDIGVIPESFYLLLLCFIYKRKDEEYRNIFISDHSAAA
jgi:hypothetical protein